MERKKITKIIIIIFCIPLAIISILFISTIVAGLLSLRKIEIRKDDLTYHRDKYLKTKSHQRDYCVFPRDLQNIMTINDYYYIDYQLRDGVIIVLDASYDEVCFEAEIMRLDNLVRRQSSYEEQSDYGKYKKLLYCDDGVLFTYPTYVAEYFFFYEYEYVSIDFENMRCIYVFIDGLSFERIPLDEEYLPKNYEVNINLEENDGYRYTIYAWYPDVKKSEWYK